MAKPFVKWAGGKRRILDQIKPHIPAGYKRYFEPFVGGGALLFDLMPKRATIIDINEDLINAYKVVQNNVDELIEDLHKHINDKDYFYEIRAIDRTDKFAEWSDVQKASRFIYMNKTCFNGLYRVNSKNQFNVPYGYYKVANICDEANLKECSEYLRNNDIVIKYASFEVIEKLSKKGDFVYFDPPYIPLSKTASFTSYSKEGFCDSMHRELSRVCGRLKEKGVNFMLSNSHTDMTKEIYGHFDNRVIEAPRFLASMPQYRGSVSELMVASL